MKKWMYRYVDYTSLPPAEIHSAPYSWDEHRSVKQASKYESVLEGDASVVELVARKM
jgi:hypothetical protein